MRSMEYPIPGERRCHHKGLIDRDKSTLEQGNDAPESNGTAARILPEGEFEKEERQAGEDKVCEVRDEERSCG